MVLASDEYCGRCNRNQAVVEEEIVDGVQWRCIECGHIVSQEFDCDWDDYDIFPVSV